MKKKIFILLTISFFLHLFIFSINKKTDYNFVILKYHINLAANIIKTGSLKNNLDFQDYLSKLYHENENELVKIDKNIIDSLDSKKSTFWYERNPGYGVLLAITWKFFNTYSYLPIIIFQIIINVFISLIVFFIIFEISHNKFYATFGLVGYIFCFPLIFLAIFPSEDIWGIWSIIIFIFFIIKEKNFKNLSIAFAVLGFFSYIHELPHILIKYLALIIPFYFFYNKNNFKIFIKKYFIGVFLSLIIPAIILSPYSIRNYLIFNKYIETRYYGDLGTITSYAEFDKGFLAKGDTLLIPMIEKKISDQNLKLNRSNPEYWDIFNDELKEYKKTIPWYKRIQNSFLRIPSLIKQRQFWGFENFTGLIKEIREKNKRFTKPLQAENKRYKTINFIKDNPLHIASVFEIFKAFIDIILIFMIGNLFFLIYVFKKKDPKSIIILMINFLIYGGNLFYFVDQKYILFPYIVNFIFMFIFISNLIKKRLSDFKNS